MTSYEPYQVFVIFLLMVIVASLTVTLSFML